MKMTMKMRKKGGGDRQQALRFGNARLAGQVWHQIHLKDVQDLLCSVQKVLCNSQSTNEDVQLGH